MINVQAAVLHAPQGALALETLMLEAPRPDEIQVRLVATGVCHTDIAMMARPFPVQQPIVLRVALPVHRSQRGQGARRRA